MVFSQFGTLAYTESENKDTPLPQKLLETTGRSTTSTSTQCCSAFQSTFTSCLFRSSSSCIHTHAMWGYRYSVTCTVNCWVYVSPNVAVGLGVKSGNPPNISRIANKCPNQSQSIPKYPKMSCCMLLSYYIQYHGMVCSVQSAHVRYDKIECPTVYWTPPIESILSILFSRTTGQDGTAQYVPLCTSVMYGNSYCPCILSLCTTGQDGIAQYISLCTWVARPL